MNLNDDPLLRQRVYEALMKVAQDTGAHPAAVLLEALAASVMTLSAMRQENAVERICRLAVKSGHQLRDELDHQARAEQATMTA